MVVLGMVSFLVISVSSFAIRKIQLRSYNPSVKLERKFNLCCGKSKGFRALNSINQPDESKETNTIEPNTLFELWLDLRQTNISPQAALLHLTNDLWDEFVAPENKSFLIDKILVNNINSENQRKQVVEDIIDEYEDEIEVLFQESSDGVITTFQSAQDSKMSMEECGRIFKIFDENTGKVNVYVNPLPALEVTSCGQWLVLDTSGVENKNDRNEAIQSLMQLCKGGLSTSFKERGGIAIDCSSNSEIFEAGALIKSMAEDGKDYMATDSGILLQSNQRNKETSFQKQIKETKYALLIPFDAVLWKTVSFVVESQQL